MNETLHFVMYPLQEVALLTMAAVYVLRIIWLYKRFRTGSERQPKTGASHTSPARGARYSLVLIATPWRMESMRQNPLLYVQFAAFHLGVASAISLSFIIPYAPELMNIGAVVYVLAVLIGAGFLAALMRLARRLRVKSLRAMSSIDDYFSIGLLNLWLALAFLCLPFETERRDLVMTAFFGVTAFFLFYVPFSKISHYLYYPFTRIWFGRSMGKRGTYPLVRVTMADMAKQQTKSAS